MLAEIFVFELKIKLARYWQHLLGIDVLFNILEVLKHYSKLFFEYDRLAVDDDWYRYKTYELYPVIHRKYTLPNSK